MNPRKGFDNSRFYLVENFHILIMTICCSQISSALENIDIELVTRKRKYYSIKQVSFEEKKI